MTVDTLSLARDLRAASVAPEQAEAIASAIGRAVQETAVTKSDLNAAIADLKATMMTWFIATGIGISAIIIAALKL
jgi:hypothetical protein